MLTLIRTEKDRKDRDKDWILCNVFIFVNTIGGIRKEKSSIFSLQFLFKCFPPCWIYNKVMYIESGYMYLTVPLSHYCFSHVHKVLVSIVTLDCIDIIRFIYCQMSTMWQLASYCQLNFHHAATQILLSIEFSSCDNSDPGHSTKFVTLPSFYITV